MKSIAITVSMLALIATILPPLLFLVGQLGHEPMKSIMLVACLLWFASAPIWMKAI